MNPQTRPPAIPSPEESAFLQAYDPQAFDRPSVTVDVVLLALREERLQTLLVRRREPPFKDQWALPGGFLHMHESLDEAAARILEEKARIRGPYLEQLYTFGDPKRDPRMRILSVAYYALVNPARFLDPPLPSDEIALACLRVPWIGEQGGPAEVRLFPESQPLPLAFDHAEILDMAVQRIRGKLDYAPIGFELLPPSFTLLELQKVHETVLGRPLNKDSFRRRMLATGRLEPTGKIRQDVGRPAALYRYLREA